VVRARREAVAGVALVRARREAPAGVALVRARREAVAGVALVRARLEAPAGVALVRARLEAPAEEEIFWENFAQHTLEVMHMVCPILIPVHKKQSQIAFLRIRGRVVIIRGIYSRNWQDLPGLDRTLFQVNTPLKT